MEKMNNKRKVSYYLNENWNAGFDEVENQLDEGEAYFMGLDYKIIHCEGKPMQETQVMIEDVNTREIKTIRCNQLIKYID